MGKNTDFFASVTLFINMFIVFVWIKTNSFSLALIINKVIKRLDYLNISLKNIPEMLSISCTIATSPSVRYVFAYNFAITHI